MKNKILLLTLIGLTQFNKVASSQNNALHVSYGSDIVINNAAAIDFASNQPFTIEGWFKSSSSTATIYSNLVDMFPYTGHEVQLNSGRVGFSLANTDAVNHLMIMTNNTYNDNQWHHFACVYNGVPTPSGMIIYMDGVVAASFTVFNTLTGPTVSGNPFHIGTRGHTNYFFEGELDEFRVWGRAICSLEVAQRKNCELVGNEYKLLSYYDFNQGVASGNNATVTTLIDKTINNHDGTLVGYSLSGSMSNWITSTAPVSGVCNYTGAAISISGTSVICNGASTQLTVSGAQTYTWSTGSNQTSIIVSPLATTTYTASGINANGCYGSKTFQLVVSECTGLEEISQHDLTLHPNPNQGQFKITSLSLLEYTIYNCLGQIVTRSQAPVREAEIDLSIFGAGVYFVRTTQLRSEKCYKVVVH